MRVLDSPTFGT